MNKSGMIFYILRYPFRYVNIIIISLLLANIALMLNGQQYKAKVNRLRPVSNVELSVYNDAGTTSFIPTANVLISGTDSLCPGDTAYLTVSMSSGTFPWSFSYKHNDQIAGTFTDLIDSTEIIAITRPGVYTLDEAADSNGPVGTQGQAFITFHEVPDVFISGLDSIYIIDNLKIDTLVGTPTGGDYYGPGVTGNFFIPVLAGAGTHTIYYNYSSEMGCRSYDSVVVRVYETLVNVIIPGEVICSNNSPFLVTVETAFPLPGTISISGGKGLIDHFDNTATVYPDSLEAGTYILTFTYSNSGEILNWEKSFEIKSVNVTVSRSDNTLVSGAIDAEYQWINCTDNTPLDGERTFTPLVSGMYSVIVWQNGCLDTSGCEEIILTDIKYKDNDQVVRIYPNPSSGNVTVILDKLYPYIEIILVETDGGVILMQKYYNEHIIPLKLPVQPGVYLLKLITRNHLNVYRLIRN
jgi:hypothetical protein